MATTSAAATGGNMTAERQSVPPKSGTFARLAYDQLVAPSSTTTTATGSTGMETTNGINPDLVCQPVTTTTTTTTTLKHRRRYCRVEGCNSIVKSQGRCQKHGAKPKLCCVPGCTKQAQGNFDKMCKGHFKEMKRQTTPIPKVVESDTPPEPEGESVYTDILPRSISFNAAAMARGETMPLVAHLKHGFDTLKPPAWHRNEERKARGVVQLENPATQLTGWERELVWMEILVLTGVPGASFRHLARAWGRDKGFHMVLAQYICGRHGDVERKKGRGGAEKEKETKGKRKSLGTATASEKLPPKKRKKPRIKRPSKDSKKMTNGQNKQEEDDDDDSDSIDLYSPIYEDAHMLDSIFDFDEDELPHADHESSIDGDSTSRQSELERKAAIVGILGDGSEGSSRFSVGKKVPPQPTAHEHGRIVNETSAQPTLLKAEVSDNGENTVYNRSEDPIPAFPQQNQEQMQQQQQHQHQHQQQNGNFRPNDYAGVHDNSQTMQHAASGKHFRSTSEQSQQAESSNMMAMNLVSFAQQQITNSGSLQNQQHHLADHQVHQEQHQQFGNHQVQLQQHQQQPQQHQDQFADQHMLQHEQQQAQSAPQHHLQQLTQQQSERDGTGPMAMNVQESYSVNINDSGQHSGHGIGGNQQMTDVVTSPSDSQRHNQHSQVGQMGYHQGVQTHAPAPSGQHLHQNFRNDQSHAQPQQDQQASFDNSQEGSYQTGVNNNPQQMNGGGVGIIPQQQQQQQIHPPTNNTGVYSGGVQQQINVGGEGIIQHQQQQQQQQQPPHPPLQGGPDAYARRVRRFLIEHPGEPVPSDAILCRLFNENTAPAPAPVPLAMPAQTVVDPTVASIQPSQVTQQGFQQGQHQNGLEATGQGTIQHSTYRTDLQQQQQGQAGQWANHQTNQPLQQGHDMANFSVNQTAPPMNADNQGAPQPPLVPQVAQGQINASSVKQSEDTVVDPLNEHHEMMMSEQPSDGANN